MPKNQLVMTLLGFMAGTTVGTSILLIVLDKWDLSITSEMQPNFEGLATILAAVIAVTGVWWQMSKTRLQDRQNHQYQVLHENRYELARLRYAISEHNKLIRKAIEEKTTVPDNEWKKAMDGMEETPVKLIGKLLSFSSNIGTALNEFLLTQSRIYLALNGQEDSSIDFDRLDAEFEKAAALAEPHIESLRAAIVNNDLP